MSGTSHKSCGFIVYIIQTWRTHCTLHPHKLQVRLLFFTPSTSLPALLCRPFDTKTYNYRCGYSAHACRSYTCIFHCTLSTKLSANFSLSSCTRCSFNQSRIKPKTQLVEFLLKILLSKFGTMGWRKLKIKPEKCGENKISESFLLFYYYFE